MNAKTGFAACIGTAVLCVSCVAGLADAATIFVDADATPGGDGVSWDSAFQDLQDALGLAMNGDDVWVAEGTYKPTSGSDLNATFELASGVRMLGGFSGVEAEESQRNWDEHPTILSGSIEPLSSAFSITVVRIVDADATTAIDGVTVRDGERGIDIQGGEPKVLNTSVVHNRSRGGVEGGGVRILNSATPLFRDVYIGQNFGNTPGGGVSSDFSSYPDFERVVFENNWSTLTGGGMSGSGKFRNVEFRSNYADDGGGGLNGDGVLSNVRFVGNGSHHIPSGGGGMLGGGTLSNVEFIDNYCGGGAGGGLYAPRPVHLVNVRFEANQAFRGGAIYDEQGGLILVNVTFVDNDGSIGREYCYGDPYAQDLPQNIPSLVVNATFFGGQSAPPAFKGQYVYARGGNLTLVNSVLWTGDQSSGFVPVWVEDSTVSISHSLIEGSGGSAAWTLPAGVIDGGDNLDADPLFTDLLAGDLRLRANSPALNAGDASAIPVDITTDLDGNPRISGGRVDMGAYEYQLDSCPIAQVEIGDSWDGLPLQEILDAQYGPGAITATSDYSGYDCTDPVEAYWLDSQVNAWLVKEIASNRNANRFGWYREGDGMATIDGTDDGVIFDGPLSEGSVAILNFDTAQRFGFYLDPNGNGDATNAPQPEAFFTNRIRNDAGPNGEGAPHQPAGGDVQCLIYDISHLRGGVPTYVLAWEDLDAGSPVSPTYSTTTTDNDYNDLVVEIYADSPVTAVVATLEAFAVREGVKLRWEVTGASGPVRFEIQRRPGVGAFETIDTVERTGGEFEWVDRTAHSGGRQEYRIAARLEAGTVYSQAVAVDLAPLASARTGLVRAVPNPFNPSTQIEYVVSRAGRVQLRVFDLAGRLVRDFDLGEQRAGAGRVDWDGRDGAGSSVASGVYVVRMLGEGGSDALRVVLLK